MKIGIASCYEHHNYGSMLQAFATEKIVNKLGYEAITVAHHKPISYMTQSKTRYYYHKITNRDIVKSKIKIIKGRIEENKIEEVVNGIRIRNSYFDNFSNNFFNLSDMMENREDLTRFASSCDAFIVGSDQLWNPVNVEHDFYTLTFVPDNIKKISYATSIGTISLPTYQIKTYQKFLNRFNYISVREQNAVDLIRKLGINKDVHLVLDPTLLLTAEDWSTVQSENPFIDDDYIFCYFLGDNQWHRKVAEQVKKMTGYKIVTLPHLDEFIASDQNFGDIKPYNVGPIEFVNLIRNAKYVCTDSFHGTCFSILNHKSFIDFNRFNEKNSQSTNTRIDSLLSELGLQDRKIIDSNISDQELTDVFKKEINYDNVDKMLEAKRRKSICFLQSALSS